MLALEKLQQCMAEIPRTEIEMAMLPLLLAIELTEIRRDEAEMLAVTLGTARLLPLVPFATRLL